jgi:hypothetical protein
MIHEFICIIQMYMQVVVHKGDWRNKITYAGLFVFYIYWKAETKTGFSSLLTMQYMYSWLQMLVHNRIIFNSWVYSKVYCVDLLFLKDIHVLSSPVSLYSYTDQVKQMRNGKNQASPYQHFCFVSKRVDCPKLSIRILKFTEWKN